MKSGSRFSRMAATPMPPAGPVPLPHVVIGQLPNAKGTIDIVLGEVDR